MRRCRYSALLTLPGALERCRRSDNAGWTWAYVDRAATRNAQAAGDAAACRDLADRHEKLAALAGEGGAVVAGLAGLVKQRDAEVGLLHGQVVAERRLIEQLQ